MIVEDEVLHPRERRVPGLRNLLEVLEAQNPGPYPQVGEEFDVKDQTYRGSEKNYVGQETTKVAHPKTHPSRPSPPQ